MASPTLFPQEQQARLGNPRNRGAAFPQALDDPLPRLLAPGVSITRGPIASAAAAQSARGRPGQSMWRPAGPDRNNQGMRKLMPNEALLEMHAHDRALGIDPLTRCRRSPSRRRRLARQRRPAGSSAGNGCCCCAATTSTEPRTSHGRRSCSPLRSRSPRPPSPRCRRERHDAPSRTATAPCCRSPRRRDAGPSRHR